MQDDASGWDFTAHYFDWMAEQQGWLGLGRKFGAPRQFENGVRNLDYVLTRGQCQCFSDGRIFSLGTAKRLEEGSWVEMQPKHPEVQRDSGGYRTGMGNGIMRDIGARQACYDAGGIATDSYSCGDDHAMAVNTDVSLEGYKHEMKRQGKILKFLEPVRHDEPIEFCSHLFFPDTTVGRTDPMVVFEGIWKSVFKAITRPSRGEAAEAVTLALRHNISRCEASTRARILPIVQEAGYDVQEHHVDEPWYADN
jgi:hypothetical protein